MVTPPALIAATPVGATIAICLGELFRIYFKKVVFPVPALPVRKMLRELLFTSSAARLNIVFDVSGVMSATDYLFSHELLELSRIKY